MSAHSDSRASAKSSSRSDAQTSGRTAAPSNFREVGKSAAQAHSASSFNQIGAVANQARVSLEKSGKSKAVENDAKVVQRNQAPTRAAKELTKGGAGGAGGGVVAVKELHITPARTGGGDAITDPALIALYCLEDLKIMVSKANAAFDAYLNYLPVDPQTSEASAQAQQNSLLQLSKGAWKALHDAAVYWPSIAVEVAKMIKLQENRELLWSSQKSFIRARPFSVQMQRAFAEFKRGEIEQAKNSLDEALAAELTIAKANAQASLQAAAA